MSYAERQTWTEIVTSTLVFALIIITLRDHHAAGLFDGADGFQIWAQKVLWMIAVGIGVAIAVSIAFAIGFAVITGEKGSDLVDERDRLIAGFGWKVTSITVSAGFIGALCLMAFGAGTLVALNAMLAAFALSDLLGHLAKLWRYRLGG